MSVDTASTRLIPLRALNQVNYCQRLYFLQYVDSVMPINEHVADGAFQHRRVSDPSLEARPRQEGDTLRTRSVSLSSEHLGLTGKLDILEESADTVYPVEHKRGEAPSGEPGYWENDAVQLCGQVLLLEEELGRTIDRAVIYYAGSKRRVVVPIDEHLRRKTLEAIATIRRIDAADRPPPPLPAELRHRCFGCSLAPICQPEETLFLIERPPQSEDEQPATVNRVIPQSDEGAVLYLQEQGSYVSKRGEHLVIRKDGEQLNRVPIVAIRQVVAFGNIQFSTQALQVLAANDVPVAFLSVYGRFIASLQPAPAKNISLRLKQFEVFTDPSRAFPLAREIIRAKIANQRTLLMRSLRSQRGERDQPASADPAVAEMAQLLDRIDGTRDPAVLLGIEGQAASLYFSRFSDMLKSPSPGEPFHFEARNRRPPRDPVNALLSFAYAMLTKDCFSALCTVGFDPYYGFFHTHRHGRPSLALDLMEEFRPVIADSVVLTLINNAMVTQDDFITWRQSCQLTDRGRKQFFQAYGQRLATEVTHPLFGYRMAYSRMIEVQARLLAACVRGEIPSYTGFTVR